MYRIAMIWCFAKPTWHRCATEPSKYRQFEIVIWCLRLQFIFFFLSISCQLKHRICARPRFFHWFSLVVCECANVRVCECAYKLVNLSNGIYGWFNSTCSVITTSNNIIIIVSLRHKCTMFTGNFQLIGFFVAAKAASNCWLRYPPHNV